MISRRPRLVHHERGALVAGDLLEQFAATVQRSLAQEVVDPIYSRWSLSGSCVAGGSSGSKPLRMTVRGGSSSVAIA
jgi:hypothetical protein